MCVPDCLHHLYGSARPLAAPERGGGDAAGAGVRRDSRIRPDLAGLCCIADLTHTLYEGFPTFSGENWFSVERVLSFGRDGLNVDRWSLMEHTGTHIDAPLHFSADGASIERLPVEDLIAPLAVIDVARRATENADAVVTPEDVQAWEARHGPLPDGACVAMNAGWDRLVNDPRFVNRDDEGRFHTPGFHPETVALLLERQTVRGIAVDTLSLDAGLATAGEFPVHRLWLGAGRWGIEAIANLDSLPEAGAAVLIGAPKVLGATGGPSRVLALY